jgi:hypothetical protein
VRHGWLRPPSDVRVSSAAARCHFTQNSVYPCYAELLMQSRTHTLVVTQLVIPSIRVFF